MAAVQVSGDTSSRQEIRYRQTVWQRTMPFAIIPILSCAEAANQIWGPQPPAADTASTANDHLTVVITSVSIALCLLILIVDVVQTRSFGITLTPTEAHVHGLRRRTIRWSDVRAVTTEKTLGTRSVILYQADRRTRLRAPITGFLIRDRDFERKYHTIGQWWLDHRDPVEQTSQASPES